MALRLLQVNRYTALGTVLTASSSQSALPVDATKNPDRNYVWRSLTQTGVQTIEIDLLSVLAVSMVAAANVKLIGTGVLELYERGDAGSPGTANLVATLPTQDSDSRVAFAFFSSQSHRHWRLRWTNPTAVNDFAELGFAGLGVPVEFSNNVQPPQIDRLDPSIAGASVDGQQTFAARTTYAYGEWAWRGLRNASDLALLRAFYLAVGRRTPFFAVLDSAKSWTGWLARLTTPVTVVPINTPASDWACNASVGWEEAR